MFNKFLKKEKSNLYLGKLTVTSRTDLKRHIDQWGLIQNEELDNCLRHSLEKLFSLPLAQDAEAPNKNDLVLEILVPKFQSGDAWDIDLGVYSFPIFWRPKVTICSRIYYLKSGKTKASFLVTEKMKWLQFLDRIFSFRSLFRFRPVFDKQDMESLLYLGCLKILLKTQKIL